VAARLRFCSSLVSQAPSAPSAALPCVKGSTKDGNYQPVRLDLLPIVSADKTANQAVACMQVGWKPADQLAQLNSSSEQGPMRNILMIQL
jgi:hypothetical protein